MTRWGFGRLLRQLEAVTSLVARALPLLALLVTFLFLTHEVWQTAGDLDGRAVLAGRRTVPARRRAVPRHPAPARHRRAEPLRRYRRDRTAVRGHAGRAGATAGRRLPPPPLGRREWGNVGLVALFSQGVQIVLVSLLIGVFFVLLGVLLVDEETTSRVGRQVHVLATISLGEQQLVVTEQLLRVAGFLTAFSGLNFTVYLVQTRPTGASSVAKSSRELRQAFAVRAVYLAVP